MVRKISLDIYDERPQEMTNYLRHYGWHFNKKMLDFALKKMYKDNKPIQPLTKEQVDNMLKTYSIELSNNELYDYVYVANMCKADFLKSSIVDDYHMALYIKDVIDHEDGYDGIVFNRWYADMSKKGVPIDWAELL